MSAERRLLWITAAGGLASAAAERKTVELVAQKGPATQDFEALFAPTQAAAPGALDAVRDKGNMPLEQEPAWIREELAAWRAQT